MIKWLRKKLTFMYQIFHANNTKLAQALLDNLVVGEWNTLLIDLAVATFVNEIAHGLDAGVAIGNPRLDDFKHLARGLGEFDEAAVIYLEKTEELKDLGKELTSLQCKATKSYKGIPSWA